MAIAPWGNCGIARLWDGAIAGLGWPDRRIELADRRIGLAGSPDWIAGRAGWRWRAPHAIQPIPHTDQQSEISNARKSRSSVLHPQSSMEARRNRPSLFRRDHKLSAPVRLEAGFRLVHARGLFFALAHDADARGGHAQADKIVAHLRRPALAQREVVFVRAARVGVPLHRDARGRPTHHPRGVLLEAGLPGVAQVSAVVREKHCIERLLLIQRVQRPARKHLVLSRHRRSLWNRWRRWWSLGRRRLRRRGRDNGWWRRRCRRRRHNLGAAGNGDGQCARCEHPRGDSKRVSIHPHSPVTSSLRFSDLPSLQTHARCVNDERKRNRDLPPTMEPNAHDRPYGRHARSHGARRG